MPALVFLCGFQFFFFPFFHFHPQTTHAHVEQVGAQEHPAHFHSEVLEAYAHLINIHPADPEQDKKFHQTHSSPDHEKDDIDYYKIQSNITSLKSFEVVKQFDFSVYLEAPGALFSYPVRLDIPVFKTPKFLETYSSRSPPFFLV